MTGFPGGVINQQQINNNLKQNRTGNNIDENSSSATFLFLLVWFVCLPCKFQSNSLIWIPYVTLKCHSNSQ